MTLRRGIVSIATLGILLCVQSALPIGAIADTPSPFGDRPEEVDLSNTYRLPSVFVDEMQVSQQEDAVNGTFGVVNENAEIVGNLRYRVELYGDMPGVDPTGNPAVLYRVTEAKELPALAPGERITEDFSASLAGIPDGSYQLRVQLVHGRGRLLGWNNEMIVIRNGAPSYVGLYGASITLPEFEQSVAALTGPNIDPKGSFTITALTENTASSARTLTPRLRLYPMDFSEKAVEDMNFAPVAIAPGESTFDLTLTAPEKSGVYAGTLELMDGDTVVSSIGEYRIVVRGMDADVLSSRLANGVSKEGDTAFVRIEHVGPSDAETRGTGLLNIDISDAKGVAGMVTIPGVPLSDGVAQGTAQVTLNRDIEGDARLTVRILAEDGTLLARQTSVIGASTLQSASADMLMLWMEWYTKPGSILFIAGMIGLLASLVLIGRSLRMKAQYSGFQRIVAGFAVFVLLLVQVQPALAQDESSENFKVADQIWDEVSKDITTQQARFGGSNGIEVWSPITVGENAAFVPNPIHYMIYWGGIADKPIVELFVNKPIHNSTIQCDKDIDFDVRVNYASCNNILSAVRVIARFDKNGNKQSTLQGNNADWKEVFDESYTQPIACTGKACIHSRTFTGKISLDGLKSGATQTTLQVVAKHNPFFDNTHQVPNDTIDPNDEYFRRHFVQAFNIWLMCQAPNTDITVQKNAPSQVNKGDKIQYDLTVSNIGQSDAANVTVTDPIPAGLTYIDNESDNRCNQSGNNVVCQIGTLAKGASTNLRITMQTGAQTVCGNVRNVASVATTTPETNNNNNQDDANTNVLCPVPQADVQIQKSGPSSVNRGNTVGYSLIVKNNGPDTAQNVVVTDAVPTGLTYIDSQSDSRCDLNGNNVVCQLGNMTNQQQTSIGLTFQTSNSTPCGPVVNVASVATTTQETNNGNNQSSFTTNIICASSSSSSSSSTPPGCIEILKEAFDPAGNKLPVVPQFTFTLDGSRTAINDSTGRAVFTNVTPGTHTVVESVPNGWTLFNVTPANGTVTVVGGAACAGITFKNRQNLPSSSSSSSSSTPIADVQITKSGPASVTRGGTVSYTLTARNNGPAVAAGVVVSDAVPAGTTYIDSQSDSRCDLNNTNNTVYCNIGTLNVNQSTNITLVFQTSNATACGVLPNIAYISTDTQETNSGNNQSSFNTNVLCPSSSSSSSSSTPPGCIEILKEAFNPFGTKLSVVPQFTFVLDGSRTVMNDSTGRATFSNVTPGTHTVTEIVPAGWNLFNITPANGTVTVVGGSACAGITFKNQQLPASSSSSSSSSTPYTDVQIVKSGAASVNRGNTIGYALNVTNNGPSSAAGVVVSDPVRPGLTYIDSQSDARCDLNNTNNTVYCNIGTMTVGQSIVLNLAFQTSQTMSCGPLTNTAYVSTDTYEPNRTNNESSFQTNVICPSSSSSSSSSSAPGTGCIEILKEAFNPFGSELSVVPQFTFTLDGSRTVTNDSTGRATFTNVTPGTHVVSETVPSGWFLFNITPANGTVNVSAGSACAGITFKNQQLPASSSSSSSTPPSSSSSSSTSTGLPDVVVEKTGPTTVQQGAEMSYTITVRNTGNATAQNVNVNDSLPSGTTYVSSSGANCAINGQALSCSIGSMSSGEVRTILVTVRVQSTVACGGTLTNIATVTTSSNESNTGNNTSNQVNTLVQCPTQNGCIEVTKEIFDVNGNQIFNNIPSFTFTLDGNRTTVSDSLGKARYNDVAVGAHTVIETVPSGWTLQSVSPSNGTVQVSAGSSCAQVLFRNRQTTTTNDFSISKTDGESEVEPGDTLTYTITVKNNNNVTVNNVTVTDTLPDEVNFEDCSDNCSRSGRFITWSNLTFGPNEEKEFEVEVEVDEDADGELENIAQVFDKTARDRTDVEEEDDDDDEDIEIDLTKTANTSEVFPGGIIEYTVRVKNTGNDTIEDLTVEDTLPPEVIVIDDGDADDHNGNRLSWDIDELDEDDTWTATYRVSVSTSAFPGQILRNEVCVESDDDDDIDECESVTVAVIGNLPQTGVMGSILGGGSSTVKLRPIRLNGGASPLSNDPIAPLAAWLSVAGLGIGAGMGAARKLLIGF